MAYDKAKVTIDLDEYNELLKQKEILSGEDSHILMAKKVIAAIYNAEGRRLYE